MAQLLLAAVLLMGALEDNEAFAQAQSLYRSGDPVAAEVALGPLLDASQPPAERARVLLWAAMCADMSGRMQVAEDRAAAAVVLDPAVKLPAEMSLRLAKLVEGVRVEVSEQQAATAPVTNQTTDTSETAPASPDAAAAAPPVPQTSAAPSDAAPAAPPAPEASSSPRSHDRPEPATNGQQPASAKSDVPATATPAKGEGTPADGLPAEEESTVTVSTSLWAVAGGALTVTMLLGAGAAVIAIYAGLTYYETLAPDAMNVATTQSAVLEALRLAGILAAAAAVAGVAAGGAAGVAWWLDQE